MSQPSSKISPVGNYREVPNKAYISTRLFDSGSNPTGTLYSYATSLNTNYATVGSLTLNANATATNCPARRVVHANGKMLIPGVNPGGGAGVDPTTGTGSTTPAPLPFPMVGVYDPVSGLNGYINLQDSTWTPYDVTLGATYDLGLANPDNTLAGDGADNDKPITPAAVITSGLSTTNTSTTVTVTASTITFGSLRVGQTLTAAAGFAAPVTITAISVNAAGTTYTLTVSAAATSAQTNVSAYAQFPAGSLAVAHTTYAGSFYVTGVATTGPVFNTNVKADSLIFVSLAGASSTPTTTPTVTVQGANTFTVAWSTNFTGLVNYFIIN